MIIKTKKSNYHLNLQSPIVISLNMLLDELNMVGIEEAMNYAYESYGDLSDEKLDEVFDENVSNVDLIHLEKEIQIKENYDIYIEDINEDYVFIL